MKIFLDDIRNPKDCYEYMKIRIGSNSDIYKDENWIICRNYQEFVDAIDDNYPYIYTISFDHDLADEHYSDLMFKNPNEYNKLQFKEKTGYDCAKYFKDYYENEKEQDYPEIYVHSMNPVGTQNILNLFK